MADVPPNYPGAPGGALPPPKKETGKVQPKKETVRINLPPKPSAAPTIKLPTLPPGGPTGAPSAAPAPAIRTAAPPSVPPPRTAAAPAAPLRSTAAAPATSRPSAPAATPKATPTVGVFDKILAIAAMVMALAAVGTTVWMLLMLNTAITQ